jgi:hypothetical protein
MISVLFISRNSVYKTFPELDCWDEDRDALKWLGGNPGIFHPPCRLFCALRHLSTAPQSEKQLAYWSVEMVRKWGGILEQPALSTLWTDCELPLPDSLFNDGYGFSVQIDQHRFGHPCRKLTWLYCCGIERLPPVPAPRAGGYVDVWGGGSAWHRPTASGGRHSGIRSATSRKFANWLIDSAVAVKWDNRNSEQVPYVPKNY